MRKLSYRSGIAGAAALLFAMAAQGQEISAADSLVLTLRERVPSSIASERDVRTIPYVSVETSRVYTCLLPLALRLNATAEGSELIVDGIAPVTICPSAMGPARGAVGLPLDNGSHSLAVRTGARVDRYALFVSDTILAVTPESTSYTRFTAAVYRRAPVNSFAFYCMLPWTDAGPDTTQEHVCTEFVQILRDSLGVQEFTFPSGGDFPFPLRGDLRRQAMRYFRYSRPEDFAVAYDLLQRFSRSVMVRVAPRADIELSNWRGRRISSYRCEAWQGCESMPPRPRW